MKILVMGLPGSGKTYLTERLVPLISAAWYNADKVREMANDWDFSDEGRDRQSKRMRTFADFEKSHGRFVFVISSVLLKQQERILMQISLFGWIPLKKVGLRILINFFKILKK